LEKVQAQIGEVKEIMIRNIDRVLEREEKIELLVEKTDVLSHDAYKFKREAKNLQTRMWWKSKLCLIAVVVLLILVVYFGMVLGCGGFKCPKCF